jgi:hypothetical protein
MGDGCRQAMTIGDALNDHMLDLGVEREAIV